MKRLARRQFRAARAAGVAGVRPRHEAAGQEGPEARAARHGYRLGWFVLRTDQLGGYSWAVYAFGALGNRPDPQTARQGVVTVCYDGTGWPPAASGAVTTCTYDAAGALTRVGGETPAAEKGDGHEPA
jgi:hypothetical protein